MTEHWIHLNTKLLLLSYSNVQAFKNVWKCLRTLKVCVPGIVLFKARQDKTGGHSIFKEVESVYWVVSWQLFTVYIWFLHCWPEADKGCLASYRDKICVYDEHPIGGQDIQYQAPNSQSRYSSSIILLRYGC